MMKPTLTTNRLTLVPVEPQDKRLLLDLLRNKAVGRFLCDDREVEEETVDALVQKNELLYSQAGVGLWLIADKMTDVKIGFCGFFKSTDLEIVYAVHPEFQKKGYATEASSKALAFLREAGVQEDVFARIDEANKESHSIAEKIGMVPAGEDINPVTGGKMRVYRFSSH
ncbi:MAG: GNAT family N-acetyltransferase [Ignavibacteriales bacterium]|nr:GNAT family N-acetyltransferase [Ignavibacteriales bacterium]